MERRSVRDGSGQRQGGEGGMREHMPGSWARLARVYATCGQACVLACLRAISQRTRSPPARTIRYRPRGRVRFSARTGRAQAKTRTSP
eukprot:1636783-Prymnesium_polylepis.1